MLQSTIKRLTSSTQVALVCACPGEERSTSNEYRFLLWDWCLGLPATVAHDLRCPALAEESDVCVCGHGFMLSSLETYNFTQSWVDRSTRFPDCSHSHDNVVKCGRVKFCTLVSCERAAWHVWRHPFLMLQCCKVQSKRPTSSQVAVGAQQNDVVDASVYDENGGRFLSFTPPVLRTWFLASIRDILGWKVAWTLISPWLQISSDSHVMQKVFSAGIHSQEFHGTQDVFNGIVFRVAFMWTDLEVKKQRQMTAMPSSWRVQDISKNPYIFSCIDTILSESQLAMLRKESPVPVSCNISSPLFINVSFLGCACAEGSVKTAQGPKSKPLGMQARAMWLNPTLNTMRLQC